MGLMLTPVAGCGPHTLARSHRLVKPTVGSFGGVGGQEHTYMLDLNKICPSPSQDTWPFPAVGSGSSLHF